MAPRPLLGYLRRHRASANSSIAAEQFMLVPCLARTGKRGKRPIVYLRLLLISEG